MARRMMLREEIELENDEIEETRFDPYEAYDDAQFIERYRFDKTTCRWLGETFCAELTRDTNRSHPLPAEIMILVALRSYASNSFQQVTGDLFCVAQSTVSKIILEVSDSIVAKADQFIKMPEGPEIRRIQEEFQRKSNIPGVIGAIDCTHVEFIAPKDDAYNYRNRKGKTSINVQAICDDKYKFINILANWPGAAHDSRILKHSQVWTEFEDHGREGILLGDGGYPLRRWLLTPYRFPPDTPAKERYNYKHSSARMVIEQSFGQLKARFHTLKAGLRLRDPKMVKKIIISCCVLHNIGKIQNLPDFDVIDANLEPEGGGGEDDDDDNAGPPQIFRDQIVQNYFNH